MRKSVTKLAVILAYSTLLGTMACGGKDGDAKKVAAKPTTSAAGAASTPAGVSDDGPIMEGDHSIIRSQAVGPLNVDEWRRPVMSFVYAVSARAGRDSEDIIVVRGIGKDTVTLTFTNDTLRRVFVTKMGAHTRSGIGVGTPFSTVASQTGAKTRKIGKSQVATIASLCGVEFATDSIALSADSTKGKATREPATVRAISVGYCKQ
jgi:hypothetical protein